LTTTLVISVIVTRTLMQTPYLSSWCVLWQLRDFWASALLGRFSACWISTRLLGGTGDGFSTVPSCLPGPEQRSQHHSNLNIRPQHLGSGHQRPVVGAAFPSRTALTQWLPVDSEDPVLLPSVAWVIVLQHSAGASHLFVPCFFFAHSTGLPSSTPRCARTPQQPKSELGLGQPAALGKTPHVRRPTKAQHAPTAITAS